MTSTRVYCATFLCLVSTGFAVLVSASTSIEKVIHSFAPYKHGAAPQAGLVADAAGNLYGTTYQGGDYDGGEVFELTRGTNGAWVLKILYSFQGGTDGAYPRTQMIFDAAGNLYGTTTLCLGNGSEGCGTVFELSPGVGGKWKETVLHRFDTTLLYDSLLPTGELIFDASGNLYGTASGGGTYGFGTVFELSPSSTGWTETILYSFTGGGDGWYPTHGLMIDQSGNLYGTTGYGGDLTCNRNNGAPYGCGVVFELAKGANGWTQTVLYTFSGDANSWSGPMSQPIFDQSGNLFGASAYGVFEMQPNGQGGWTFTVLPSLMFGDLLFDKAGNLYGTNPYTYALELMRGANDTWTPVELYAFQQGNDGAYPYGGLIFDAAGNLYGTTAQTYNGTTAGTVFELSPSSQGIWTENVLYRFASTDGSTPEGGLVADAQGNLYGTTFAGGSSSAYCPASQQSGCGTVFKMTRSTNGSWKSEAIYNFTGTNADGAGPAAGLVADLSGNLYGTTQYGGNHGGGVAFRLSHNANGTWSRMTLYSFGAYSEDGDWPVSDLIMDSAGNMYGTTLLGGIRAVGGCDGGCGTVYRLSPNANGSWTKTTLYMFTGSEGSRPYGGLTLDSAGNLYGTAELSSQYGSVFRLSPSGGGTWALTILYNFTGGADGGFPMSAVTFDGNGNLFGTTNERGNMTGCGGYGCGTVFELKPSSSGSWQFVLLHTFDPVQNPLDGGGPATERLIFDSAGNLYGTTQYGGIGSLCGVFCGNGVVFKLTPSATGEWNEQIVQEFAGAVSDGGQPTAGVIQGPDGNLYGTTTIGGSYSAGSVFEVAP